MVLYAKMFGHVIGPKYLPSIPRLAPSLVGYGISAVVGICWFTEWKAVLQYVPFYGDRYNYVYEDDKNVHILPINPEQQS